MTNNKDALMKFSINFNKDAIMKYSINFNKDWSFKIENASSNEVDKLPTEDPLNNKTNTDGPYIRQYSNSLFSIYKDCFKNTYILFIDNSQLQNNIDVDFKESKLHDSVISALFLIFSDSNLFNDSLFFGFLKHFLRSRNDIKIIPDYIYSLIEKQLSDTNNNSFKLNSYTLFFCFLMRGFEFLETSFTGKLNQEGNNSIMQNLITLFVGKDKNKNILQTCPDRFRESLILTLFYSEYDNKFKNSLKTLHDNQKSLKAIKQNIEKDKNDDEYIQKFFDRFFSLMELQPDIETWLNLIDIFKLILPNRYWSYFSNTYLFQSAYFHFRIELSSQIIIRYNLFNQLINKKPFLLNDYINYITKNDTELNCLKNIDKNALLQYYQIYNFSSFKELLLTNQGFKDFSEFEFTNRFKYLDCLVCILKFSHMPIEKFFNTEDQDLQILTEFLDKVKEKKYVDLLQEGKEVIFKDTFSPIVKYKFRNMTTDFKERRQYIVKSVTSEEISSNCIFYQMINLNTNKSFNFLIENFMKDNLESFKSKAGKISKFFDDVKKSGNLPNDISFEKMDGYEPPKDDDDKKSSKDDIDDDLIKVDFIDLDQFPFGEYDSKGTKKPDKSDELPKVQPQDKSSEDENQVQPTTKELNTHKKKKKLKKRKKSRKSDASAGASASASTPNSTPASDNDEEGNDNADDDNEKHNSDDNEQEPSENQTPESQGNNTEQSEKDDESPENETPDQSQNKEQNNQKGPTKRRRTKKKRVGQAKQNNNNSTQGSDDNENNENADNKENEHNEDQGNNQESPENETTDQSQDKGTSDDTNANQDNNEAKPTTLRKKKKRGRKNAAARRRNANRNHQTPAQDDQEEEEENKEDDNN